MNTNRKGFTLIELLIVVVIVGILALAAIPLITANTRDARRGEGEQILGSMKNRVKVAYTKTNSVPGNLVGAIGSGGCGVQSAELAGKYFNATNAITGTSPAAILTVTPGSGGNSSDGTGTGNFNMANPATDTITWPN